MILAAIHTVIVPEVQKVLHKANCLPDTGLLPINLLLVFSFIVCNIEVSQFIDPASDLESYGLGYAPTTC